MKKIFDSKNVNENVFSNLKYPKKKHQLDGLVIFNDSLILIEIKNKKKRTLAGKTSHELLEVLKSDFQAHINEAFEQTSKAVKYIQSAKTVTFETKHEQLLIKNDEYNKIYKLVICLENFAPLISNLKLVQAWDSKFFPANIFPWITTIYDLIIICDWLESPELFLDYLDHRIDNDNSLNIYSIDEIDYLGYYLAFGDLKRQFSKDTVDSLFIITGFSVDIERYYDHLSGKINLSVKNLNKIRKIKY